MASVPMLRHSSSRVVGSSFSFSAVMGGFSPITIVFAVAGSVDSRRQYMNPRSRRSGSSASSVHHFRTCGTNVDPFVGRWMKSLTVAVRRASWTSIGSSWNVAR